MALKLIPVKSVAASTNVADTTDAQTIGDASYDLGTASKIAVMVHVHGTPTGTGPTMDIDVEHSNHDGTDYDAWVTLKAFVQFDTTADATRFVLIPDPGTAANPANPKMVGRYIRLRATLNNADNVFVTTVLVNAKE